MDGIKEIIEWAYALFAALVGAVGYLIRRAIAKLDERQDKHDERIREIERRYVPSEKMETRLNKMQSDLSREIQQGHQAIRDENVRIREDLQYIRRRVDEK